MKKILRFLLPLLAVGAVLCALLFQNAPPIRRAAEVMDPAYSRSASNFEVIPPFLQTDGRSLYYVSRWNTPHIRAVTGKSSRMEILLPTEPAQQARSLDPFLPLFLCDDSFYIGGYTISLDDKSAWEMSVRYPFAFADQTLYYTVPAPTQETGYYPELLCTYHIPTGETRECFILDDLTAVYSDGFVYEWEKNFYYLPLPYTGEEPVPLPTSGKNRWLFTLLCTDTRLIQLDTDSIEIYDFTDGTWETVFASDGNGNAVTMAACANEEEMYVSRRLVDIKFWPVADLEGINGTYRYTFADGTWEKINDTIYDSLMQFDSEYLYGRTYDWQFLRQIRLK